MQLQSGHDNTVNAAGPTTQPGSKSILFYDKFLSGVVVVISPENVPPGEEKVPDVIGSTFNDHFVVKCPHTASHSFHWIAVGQNTNANF